MRCPDLIRPARWLRRFAFACLVSLVAAGAARGQGAVGGVRGSVRDADFGVPLANVRVTVMGAGTTALTDERGGFVFDALTPGVYDVMFSKDGYERRISADVGVTPGSFAEVQTDLTGEVYEESELVVTGDLLASTDELLVTERQDASGIFDSIGTKAFTQMGVTTAAGALRRIVGTSVVDDRYVVVRGLSDRYVNTLVNGARVPSADPDRRAVNVDLFPTKLIDSISVAKTFTPDLPGDSSGGSVNIRTRGLPEDFVFELSTSTDYYPESSLRTDFPTYRGGGIEGFGFDRGGRDLPAAALNAPIVPTRGANNLQDAAAYDEATRSLTDVIAVEDGTSGLDYNFSFAFGGRGSLLGRPLGLLLGGNLVRRYTMPADYRIGRYQFSGKGIPLDSTDGEGFSREFNVLAGVQESLAGGLMGLSFQPHDDHTISVMALYNQAVRDQAEYRVNPEENVEGAVAEQHRIYYNERSLFAFQIVGEHLLRDLRQAKVDWMGTWGKAREVEPDQRIFKDVWTPSENTYRIRLGANDLPSRQWREFDEESFGFKLDVTLPLSPDASTASLLRVGMAADSTFRDFTQESFVYTPGGRANPNYTSVDGESYADVFLEPDNIGRVGDTRAFRWILNRTSNKYRDFTAEQLIAAGYLMAELELTSRLKVVTGVRIETTDLQTTSKSPAEDFDETTFFKRVSKTQQTDILPALNVSFQMLTNMTVRLAASQTVARPTLKEIGPVEIYDFELDEYYRGNQNLKLSQIQNFDLRWEWMPRPSDLLALSGFYKRIENPIERVLDQTSESTFIIYKNFPLAEVYGIEMEFRKKFDDVAGLFGGWDFFKCLEFGVNGSYLFSKVQLDAITKQTYRDLGIFESTRPLQGQPAYTANASLTYNNAASGTFAGLFYNVTGPTLYLVGLASTPNVIEQPAPSLDLTIQQKFFKNWTATFRAKNLMDPEYQRTYAFEGRQYTYSSFRKGPGFSVGLSYSF